MERYNPLIDKFPTKYKNVELNTDFRVALEIFRIQSDPSKDDTTKKLEALNKLYKFEIHLDDPADLVEFAWSGLEWFLKGGDGHFINIVEKDEDEENNNEDDEESNVKKGVNEDFPLDYDFDSSRIYTAFLRSYDINLIEIEYMHYFDFLYRLQDIDDECALSRVMGFRTETLKGKKGNERSALRRMKKLYEIPYEINEEDRERLRDIGIDDEDLSLFMQ